MKKLIILTAVVVIGLTGAALALTPSKVKPKAQIITVSKPVQAKTPVSQPMVAATPQAQVAASTVPDPTCLSQKASQLASIQTQESQVQAQIDQITLKIRGEIVGEAVTPQVMAIEITDQTASLQNQLSALKTQYISVQAQVC